MTFLIYLIGIVDTIKILSLVVAIVGLIISAVVSIITVDYCDHDKILKGVTRFVVKPLLPFLLFGLFVPDSKTIAAMYLLPKLAHNEKLNQIPDKALDALNLKLDEWVKDLGEEKK